MKLAVKKCIIRTQGRVVKGTVSVTGAVLPAGMDGNEYAIRIGNRIELLHLESDGSFSRVILLKRKGFFRIELVSRFRDGEFCVLCSRLIFNSPPPSADVALIRGSTSSNRSDGQIKVWAPPHVDWMADAIIETMRSLRLDAVRISAVDAGDSALHVILCPHVCNPLPKQYIAYQLEQWGSHYFTADYIARLNSAVCVWEYCLENIRQYGSLIKNVYHVPVGRAPKKVECARDIDVLFVGASNDRRHKILDELRAEFKVVHLNNAFGGELLLYMARAKVILNIHYFENALLETPRLWQCVSMGKCVISEEGRDQRDHGDFCGLVDFCKIDDVQTMRRLIRERLAKDVASTRSVGCLPDKKKKMVEPDLYRHSISRALLGLDMIGLASLDEPIENAPIHYYGISECPARIELFEKEVSPLFSSKPVYFRGIKHRQGWIGCGMTLKYYIKTALQRSTRSHVFLVEEDAKLTSSQVAFIEKIDGVLSANLEKWDICALCVADFPADLEVIDMMEIDGVRFARVDYFVSMVANFYNRTCCSYFSDWNEGLRNVNENTIDRVLGRDCRFNGLRVWVPVSFLCAHQAVPSTLWGCVNDYSDMFKRSERVLKLAVEDYLAAGGKVCKWN